MTKAFQILVIGSFTFLVSSVCAQEAKLIEAAKKEGGKIVAYGSLESDTTEAVKKAFEKKTGLSMEYWRASATKVVDRATSEFRAQKPLSMSFWFMMRRCGSC
jgi:ABC-type thiamine transport system substrate-binding protein